MNKSLRAFYELLRDLIQGAWIRFVQKHNANKLGNATDLGTFLFGQERANLEAYRPILIDVQRGECMYCRKPLPKNSQVDHFVPWSRYPADLGHNFVLAHQGCNRAKSDYLAAEDHLAAWGERNKQHQDELRTRLQEAALPCDLSASVQIAQWAYEQTEKANGQVWVMEKVLHHFGPTWRNRYPSKNRSHSCQFRLEVCKSGSPTQRPELAALWGYEDWHALGRGDFTPKGQKLIVLFITEKKQKALTQYADTFDGTTLTIEGEKNHGSDQRLAKSLNHDDVHLFFRKESHGPFTYHGPVFLEKAILNTGPTLSRFIFSVSKNMAAVVSAIATEQVVSGIVEDEFVPDAEGKKKIREHVVYERSKKNRAKALELQGTKCVACGFDFNEFDGTDYAQDFILVHHTTSITKTDGPVDPATGLVPICANCHYMVHKSPTKILSVEEVKQLIQKAKLAKAS